MSTISTDSSGQSGTGINRIISHLSTTYESPVGNGENRVNPMPTTSATNNETTWINTFNDIDRMFSGGILHLVYRLIDITILLAGLISSNTSKQIVSSSLAITSICLLIFYFIDLFIILLFLIRNIKLRRGHLTEEQKLEQLRRAAVTRGFFTFFKIIPICFGTGYSFPSTVSDSNELEMMRFCLGIVCLSTWLVILMPSTRPELPLRRSLLIECFILVVVLVINSTYIGTVGKGIANVDHPTCIYNKTEDLYLGAPLKSFGTIGIIIFSCTTVLHITNLILNQIYFRQNRYRRIYSYYYALQYTLNYIITIVIVYYFSIGGLFLFQPRTGQPCRDNAPDLYRTLLIWEWIRILLPLIAIPLLLILCCLGVFFGVILTFCLPASITVPLLQLLHGWTSATPMNMNPNPPATQENIDAVPIILFGQDNDQFNQTECSICRNTFEANEQLKKLQCGHLFHPECVSQWLLITRVCPVCRQRMSSVNP